jgi:hypothetical protein
LGSAKKKGPKRAKGAGKKVEEKMLRDVSKGKTLFCNKFILDSNPCCIVKAF